MYTAKSTAFQKNEKPTLTKNFNFNCQIENSDRQIKIIFGLPFQRFAF